ncbi:MAG: discoidin domain-containing protein [Paludibacter sp.]|nr:discoidin domain-containing protein [Paludibacter sp.]
MKKTSLLFILSAITFIAFGQKPTPTVTAFAQYNADYPPSLAFDGDKKTRWASPDHKDFDSMWIQADYGKPITVSKIKFKQYKTRITKFVIEYQEGDQWIKLIKDSLISDTYKNSFKPVTAQVFKLTVLERSEKKGPGFYEISFE